MNVPIAITSIISLAAFTFAMVLPLTRLAGNKRMSETVVPSLILAGTMAVYVFVSLSNSLEYLDITSGLDFMEDYVEVLFAPLLVFSVYAWESEAQLAESERSSRALQHQYDLLLAIVDTTPSGIMIVAPGGHITFANEAARTLLGIREDEESGWLTPTAWELADATGAPTSLQQLLGMSAAKGARHTVTWPDGHITHVAFSMTPMTDASTHLGGAVVAVERINEV